MRLGLGSYTYTWAVGVPGELPPQPLDAWGLLDRARELGVRVVQYCDNLPLVRLSARDLGALASAAAEAAISVEIGTRGISTDNLLAHLELARRFHAPFLRLVVDTPGDEPAPDQVVARLRPLLPRFADANLKLAIENHDRFPARVLGQIVEELGPDRVGICLDTVNSFGAMEGPREVVPALAPYTLNLHVKDFTIARVNSQMGFVVSGCAVGQGRLDVPWLLEQLTTARPDVNAIIELWTPPAGSLEATLAREAEWARQSVAYLRQYLPD